MAAQPPHFDYPDGAQFVSPDGKTTVEIRNGQPVVVGSAEYVDRKASDAKIMEELGAQAASLDELQQHAHAFMAENDKQTPLPWTVTSPFIQPTEPTVHSGHTVDDLLGGVGHWASTLGNPANWDSHLKAMQAQTVPMATAMRAPGMRMTQQEFNVFRGVAPSVSNPRDANRELANNIDKAKLYTVAKHSFYDSYRQHHGSLDGVDQHWAAYKASRFDKDGVYHAPSGEAPAPADPRATANQALIAKSAAARQPAAIDIEGNVVSP